MRTLFIAVCVVIGIVAAGRWSGNQPPRDEVAAARLELGIELESRRVDVGEVTLHVVLAGPESGPPVVLLHGFPELWYAWRGPLRRLAEAGFRVIAPDQRGYNRSDKPKSVEAYRVAHLASDVAKLIAELGYDRADVAAHDWGGGVAWRLVIDHPDRVRRLAILDTPHPQAAVGFESSEKKISWYRTFMRLPIIPEWTARVANWRLLASSLRDTSHPGTFPEPVMDIYRSAWDREEAISTMMNWYRANRGDSPASPEWRVAAPTLVLLAPGDAFIPSDLSRRSARFLDDGRLVELESGTHWVIQEDPDTISRHLIEFFGPVGEPGSHHSMKPHERPATASSGTR